MLFAPWKIPVLVTRPWRLVPELDGFPDRDCRAFTEGVTGVRLAGLGIAVGVAIVVGPAIVVMGMSIADLLPRRSPWVSRETVQGRGLGLAFALFMISTTICLALTPYGLMLRAALKRHISRAVCPKCSYSLLGLPLVITAQSSEDESISRPDDAVQCPECGFLITLSNHGLRRQDIIAGAIRAREGTPPAATPTLTRLKYLLLGIAIVCVGMWVVAGQEVWIMIAATIGLVSISLAADSAGLKLARINRDP